MKSRNKLTKTKTITLPIEQWKLIVDVLEDATDMQQQGARFKSDALEDAETALNAKLEMAPTKTRLYI